MSIKLSIAVCAAGFAMAGQLSAEIFDEGVKLCVRTAS